MAYEPIAAPAHSAAKRLWFNNALQLTTHAVATARPLQLNSVMRTGEEK
jgi:hypothetical protein